MISNYQKNKNHFRKKKTIYNNKIHLDYLIKKKNLISVSFFFYTWLIVQIILTYLIHYSGSPSISILSMHLMFISNVNCVFFFIRINNYIKQFNSFIHWSISNYFLSDKTYSIFNLIKIYFLVLEFSLIRFNQRILKDKLLFILSYRFSHGNYLD
jgi:hypothetical protein